MKKCYSLTLILALTALFVAPCTLTAEWNAAHAVQKQTRIVTGRVTGPDGEFLPGVYIQAKGTSLGTTTDIDGYFTLEVPTSCTILIFTFVGYQRQEVKIPEDGVIKVILQEDAQM